MRARLEQRRALPAEPRDLVGEVPLIGSPSYTTEGLLAMDKWLSAVEGDTRHSHAEEKIAHRQAGRSARPLLERRRRRTGVGPGVGLVCQLAAAQTRFSTPRRDRRRGASRRTSRSAS